MFMLMKHCQRNESAEQFCYWLIDTVMENKGSYETLLNTKLKAGLLIV